jgi:plastocyanin domain-containing protein
VETSQILVTLAGVLAIAGIVWFFWLKKATGVRAVAASSGYQEAMILVKGGYNPDTIIVERGKPVRLTFRREESSPCSEQVVFDAFGRHATLPEGEQVAVELPPPEQPGEYPFTCHMGMLRGTLVVE